MKDSRQSPGDVIRTELERRGWTQTDLAMILGKHLPAVSQIIQGKRSITPDMATALGAAFGNSPETWLELDATFRLSLIDADPDVENRARLFGLAPVADLERRGWIRRTETVQQLEQELCRFFNVENLEQKPEIHVNAKQSFKSDSLNPSQIAWCFRAARLATAIDVKRFKQNHFESALPEVRKLADYPQKAKHLPRMLAEMGVRLIIVEPLPHSRIDGAAFWLADDAPVIALSIRYDRIDGLWFTLAHELAHLRHNDAQSVDMDLVGDLPPERFDAALERRREKILADVAQLKHDIDAYNDAIEARANREASDFLIPREKMQSFVLRVKPFYSKIRIIQFAHVMKIHPGIIIGQLQHLGEVPWSSNRDLLAKVRETITQCAMTDGWGKTAPTL